MNKPYWEIIFHPVAEKEYKKLGKQEQKQFINKIKRLANNPNLSLALPLSRELAGYYKLEFAGRYRAILTQIEEHKILVICSLRIRKGKDREDVYEIFKRWLDRNPDWLHEFLNNI